MGKSGGGEDVAIRSEVEIFEAVAVGGEDFRDGMFVGDGGGDVGCDWLGGWCW